MVEKICSSRGWFWWSFVWLSWMVRSWSFHRPSERNHQHKPMGDTTKTKKQTMIDLRSTRTNQYRGAQDKLWTTYGEIQTLHFYPKFCADDVVQKDDESSTTKPPSSENKPTSKSPTWATNLLHHLKIIKINSCVIHWYQYWPG